jgi:hypothetical protein
MKDLNIKKFVASLPALLFLAANAFGQTGGNFSVTQSVIASGGGQNSSGGVFSVDATIGQSLAGANSAGGIFGLRGGFWTSGIAPSAARVSVGGRVRTANGSGIRNVIVTLIEPNGAIRTAQTGTFGYFKFDGVEVSGTYIISVSAKRYAFSQPTIIRTVQEDISDLEFVADDQ